jgi:hypothetical protein
MDEVIGYLVFRMDRVGQLATWSQVGSTDANTTVWLDPSIPVGEVALYYVKSHSEEASSPPSEPAASGGMLCNIVAFWPGQMPPVEIIDLDDILEDCLAGLSLHAEVL